MNETMAETVGTESPYDAIADFYNRAWADWYLPSIRPFLRDFLFAELPRHASILDVCCGCGHVTCEVARQGFRVTGIDSSKALVRRARESIPEGEFRVADARNFRVDSQFDGALSTFDSFNHLLTYADLKAALRSTHAALKPGAPFIFDMNLEEAYSLDLGTWVRYSDDHSVGFVRGQFDRVRRRARTELLWFAQEPGARCWMRSDSTVEEQCYSREEIERAVQEAGFYKLECFQGPEVGVTDELGYGRIYGRAWA
jgi:SAM-dependent methyltransferase